MDITKLSINGLAPLEDVNDPVAKLLDCMMSLLLLIHVVWLSDYMKMFCNRMIIALFHQNNNLCD